MAHTVLVVDDDPAVLDVIASMLEDIGCDVVCAQSGNEALETLTQQQNISILITDINMPGMDGHELAERATRIRADAQGSSVIWSRAQAGWLPAAQEALL